MWIKIFALLSVLFMVLCVSGVFLHEYLYSIRHWTSEAVKFVNLLTGIATAGSMLAVCYDLPVKCD
jgi:hypothetical protein